MMMRKMMSAEQWLSVKPMAAVEVEGWDGWGEQRAGAFGWVGCLLLERNLGILVRSGETRDGSGRRVSGR